MAKPNSRAHNGIPTTWNGKPYPSIKAAADDDPYISYQGMYGRIKAGHTCDDDVAALGTHTSQPTIWNDTEYPSLRQAAAAAGISPASMHYRKKCGYTCDEDMHWVRSK